MQQSARTIPIVNGGRFDFDDGGTYCGGWEDGKAHGHGVCTGPKGQGEYSGSWHYGFEVSGVYTWPSGSTYEGHWQNGKRHGLGVESRGRWIYRGEWTQGFKGRYGVRQSTTSGAKYEGTWANGLQDGYGSEVYADGGTYQGQWLRGMRHGYGVRTSAPFGLASHFRGKNMRASMTSLHSESASATPDPTADRDKRMDDSRGGFVLKSRSDVASASANNRRRRSLVEKSTNLKRSILSGLRLKKQRSTGDIDKRGMKEGSVRSAGSGNSWASEDESGVTSLAGRSAGGGDDSNLSFVSQDELLDANVTETYMGEWKNDKRSGFGICERSDGLKYEGEWYNNKKYGYGVTILKDGTREEGKYKNNVLVSSQKRRHIFLIRSAKFRERIESAVNAAIRGSQIALQKADIAISRTATARGKGEQADVAAHHSREDSDLARLIAKQYAPEFSQPGTTAIKKQIAEQGHMNYSKFKFGPRARDGSKSVHGHGPSDWVMGAGDQSMDMSEGDVEMMMSDEEQFYMQTSDYGGGNYNYETNPGHDAPNRMNYLDPGAGLPVGDREDYSQQRGGRNSSFRRGGGSFRNVSSQAMTDHFDQYKIGGVRNAIPNRIIDNKNNIRNRPSNQLPNKVTTNGDSPAPSFRPPSQNVNAADWTPDSGVSMDTDDSPPKFNQQLNQRVKTGNQIMTSLEQTYGPQTTLPVSSPQRTSSLYISKNKATAPPTANKVVGGGVGGGGGGVLKRKKSLPDVSNLPGATSKLLSREEVSALSSTRREQVRRDGEEADRYRANPLLYVFNPRVKEWLIRQQLTVLVLLINLSLAILFFNLLT